MTSNINPAFPVYGSPTTQSVRDNFAYAKVEIEELQAAIAQYYPGGAMEGVTIGWTQPAAASFTLIEMAGTVTTQGRILGFVSSTLASTATGTQAVAALNATISPGGASLANFHGLQCNPSFAASAAPVTSFNSYYARAESASDFSANVTTYNGMLVDPPSWSGGGTITNFNGTRVANPGAKVTGGTVTALKAEIASGSGRWNVYASGTASNHFRGNVLIGNNTTDNGIPLDVTGTMMRLSTAKTPASAADTGVVGSICWDADYIYVCVATNTWKRAALATWP